MSKETIFAEGFYYKPKHENAPSFVLGSLSCKVDDAIAFLSSNSNDKGYVNMQILESKDGKPYVKLDDFVPTPKGEKKAVEEEDDDLPF